MKQTPCKPLASLERIVGQDSFSTPLASLEVIDGTSSLFEPLALLEVIGGHDFLTFPLRSMNWWTRLFSRSLRLR